MCYGTLLPLPKQGGGGAVHTHERDVKRVLFFMLKILLCYVMRKSSKAQDIQKKAQREELGQLDEKSSTPNPHLTILICPQEEREASRREKK